MDKNVLRLGDAIMQYFKRILFLVVLIGLSVLAARVQPINQSDFTVETVMYCFANIFIVITIIGLYIISKTIVRTAGIIIIEFIILIFLILFSFFGQFDSLLAFFFTTKLGIQQPDMNTILYMQFILGIWIITLIKIIRNKKIRRNKLSNTTRYLR